MLDPRRSRCERRAHRARPARAGCASSYAAVSASRFGPRRPRP